MLFSVIFSVDDPQGVSIKTYTPPQAGRLWTRTEGDEQYEYGYLEGRWEKGKHRKWTALLTRKQFDAFVSKLELTGLVALNLYDDSSIAQATADYSLSDRWSIGALASGAIGAGRTERGSLPQESSVLLKATRYF